MRRVWLLLLIAVLCLGSTDAWGRRGRRTSDPLADAKKLYAKLRYEEAVPKLQQALKGELDVTRRIEVLALLGTIQIILDDEPAARKTFASLIRLDREHKLDPSLSPKILEIFDNVSQKVFPPQTARFVTPPSINVPDLGRVTVSTQIKSSDDAVTVRWHHRLVASESGSPTVFHIVVLQVAEDGSFAAELPLSRPPADQGPRHVLYYFDILGRDQQVLASVGDAPQPRELELLPQSPSLGTSTSQNWLLWAGLGTSALVVTSVIVVTAVLLNSSTTKPGGTLGEFTLGQ